MKTTRQILGAVSVTALIAASASPAYATGTDAGATITNNVSVSFDVGGVAQTAVTDGDTFTVDRKVNVTVAEVGGAATSTTPGATAATTFQVTNLTNDTADFALSLSQATGDDFDISNVKYYVDDGDGSFDAGDTQVTYLDELAEDITVTVHVVGDIPLSAVTGDTADVTLIADAGAGGSAGTPGAALTATTGANTAGVDTVLADAAGDDDAANAGDHSDTDSYTVTAASLTATKTSSIVSDPVNGTTNPKAIPGATVEYCIVVANATGSATATNVQISDVVPADLAYDAGFGIYLNGDASCTGGSNSPGGTYTSGTSTVSGTLNDIAAGTSLSLYFRATID